MCLNDTLEITLSIISIISPSFMTDVGGNLLKLNYCTQLHIVKFLYLICKNMKVTSLSICAAY